MAPFQNPNDEHMLPKGIIWEAENRGYQAYCYHPHKVIGGFRERSSGSAYRSSGRVHDGGPHIRLSWSSLGQYGIGCGAGFEEGLEVTVRGGSPWPVSPLSGFLGYRRRLLADPLTTYSHYIFLWLDDERIGWIPSVSRTLCHGATLVYNRGGRGS